MRILYDASSLFNLASGGMLEVACCTFDALIGPQVYDECDSIRDQLDGLIERNRLELIDDMFLPTDLFFEYLDKFGLGQGETECICFAIISSQIDKVSCDDRKARQAISSEFGSGRLTGTLGQLGLAASRGVISPEEGFAAYQRMIAAGGFLPSVTAARFNELAKESI